MSLQIGHAHGAIMHALPQTFAALAAMTDDDMARAAAPWVGRVPPCTDRQLDRWATRVAAPTLGELGDMGELAGLKKKLKKALRKVAKIAIAPQWGGVKGIKAQVKFAKKHKGILLGAAGLITGNPLLVKAGQELKKRQGQAQAESDYADMVSRTSADNSPAPADDQSASMPPVSRSYSGGGSAASLVDGPVTRLAPDEDQPRVVGLSWQGITDHMKANPVPWAIGAGAALYLFTRKN